MGRRLTAILPNRGKQRAHDEKAAFPSWASTVPNLAQTDIRITCRFLLNHMVKVDNRHTSIHHQWSCLLNAKCFTVAVHITEQGISVGEEYRQIARQQSIANHGSCLSTFAYTRLVAYDYLLSTFLYIINGQCNTIDLLGGQCFPQFLMAHVQSVCYISADIAPKRFV